MCEAHIHRVARTLHQTLQEEGTFKAFLCFIISAVVYFEKKYSNVLEPVYRVSFFSNKRFESSALLEVLYFRFFLWQFFF